MMSANVFRDFLTAVETAAAPLNRLRAWWEGYDLSVLKRLIESGELTAADPELSEALPPQPATESMATAARPRQHSCFQNFIFNKACSYLTTRLTFMFSNLSHLLTLVGGLAS